MARRGFFECSLKLLNFVLAVAASAMVGYGVYLVIEWFKASSLGGEGSAPLGGHNSEMLKLGRPMLLVVSLSASLVDELSKAWFIYLFIGIGVIFIVISCFGCIGTTTRNGCCLSFYSILVILLILVELMVAAFIVLDHKWKEVLPADKTGDFDMIYNLLKDNWKFVKWVALGIVLLEALAVFLAFIVRAANRHVDYDGDAPTSGARQPLIHRQGAPESGAPVLDIRPIRNDAWSQRLREKYGLDLSHFGYNPSDPSRLQQATIARAEEKSRCAIL